MPHPLTTTLLRVSAIAASAGCPAGLLAPEPDAGNHADASVAPDSNLDADLLDADTGPPLCPDPTVSSGLACQVAAANAYSNEYIGADACVQACATPPDANCWRWTQICVLPQDYQQAFNDLQPDGGVTGDATVPCPDSGSVLITCEGVGGRNTEGIPEPPGSGRTDLGAVFAARAYLEAASVFAFERLERELSSHGAPTSLRRDARRARRDEVRHTAMQTRLARRHGGQPRLPAAPPPIDARPLLDVALENAVEGCVRETYGAAAGFVEARRSRDRRFRRASTAIAFDECRHAELAWAVHAWAMARLTSGERYRVERAMVRAIADLRRADPDLTELLVRAVWS
jgi:hypothetical protein